MIYRGAGSIAEGDASANQSKKTRINDSAVDCPRLLKIVRVVESSRSNVVVRINQIKCPLLVQQLRTVDLDTRCLSS